MYGNLPYGGAPYGDQAQGTGHAIVRAAALSLAVSALPSVVAIDETASPQSLAAQLSLVAPTVAIYVAERPRALPLSLSVNAHTVHAPKPVARLRELARIEPVWLVEVSLKNSGPTLFFSDRNVEVSGRRYEDYVASVEGITEEISPAASQAASVTFRNERFRDYGHLIEIGEDYPLEGAEVTIRECLLDDGCTPSAASTVFKGALDAPRGATLSDFTCRLLPQAVAKDRLWRQPTVELGAWPNAYEDLGEAEPIIYGSGLTVPALRVDWGARTTLQAAITASSAGLELSDASRFPAAGSVWIDYEKIAYSGKSGNALTGLSRAQGGTTAKAHRAGADVVEAKAQYDSLLASHELHSVGAVYAEMEGRLWRVVSGVSAVLSGGRHLLRATEHIRVKAVEDTIAVSDNIAVTVGGSTKNVYPDGLEPNPAPGTHDVSNSGHAYDGNENTACTLNPNKNTTGRLQLGFPDTSYGAISTQYIHARLLGAITVGGGWTPAQVDPATAGWFRFSKAGGGWGDYVSFSNQNTGESPLVYEVYKEVEYSSSATKSGSAYRSGDIVATHSVERFHAVVSGAKDPDGNYGGLGSIIERPDRVIRHFLAERMGLSHEDIDSESFGAAGSSYSSSGYAFAFRVGEKITPSKFLSRMARECRSTLRCSKGTWKLHYLSDSAPSAKRTISCGELAGKSAKFGFARAPFEELSNELNARFRRNYSRLRGESAWDATASASDAASQTKYGIYPKEVDFDLIRDAAMASHVLSHMLLERKDPRLTVEYPVFWEHFDLEPGDTVEIDNPLFGGRKFLIEFIKRIGKFRAEIRAFEWW